MSQQRPLTRYFFGPSLSCSLGALLNEIGKGADRRDDRVKQNVPVALFLGHVEPDAIPAQPLVSSNLARSIFDRISVVFEMFPDNLAHQTIPAQFSFLLDAFARIAAAMCQLRGDLRAFVKRIFGNLQPYNYVSLRLRSRTGTTWGATC